MKVTSLFAAGIAFFASCSAAFAPPTSSTKTFGVQNTNSIGKAQGNVYLTQQQPASLQKERHSMAPVQTMSLFGLGGPELAIILIAAAFVLGPQKLAELGKDAGKIAGELKEVPKEFQKGLSEGEQQAAQIKKEMLAPPAETVSDDTPEK
uniref:Uncharacterized protein n=1 Tax=Eucampia antarctica TaxID=49252 RepID=A0A7S2R4G4_9STRA